ncbi:winged helix-turn-helix domain-containing protein [Paenibacillus alkalitolerans]|uniref:winged helix-turn-helix domain-containing protein n=1 Tax=Paenibacillus alkalitolerans TaxID=2799335 RepID=UPI0018F610BA|nr:winged helix-turn-helix domain-containing protein [Paenibacillus alkalitolerans]
MNRIEFDKGTFSVTWNGQSVALLPKEFELLEFMHRHSGQTLSREQLLHAVWPLQFPTDRTVDDHVYRLRKKLALWDPMIRIETVRSSGYRFAAKVPGHTDNPLHHVPSFTEDMRNIFTAFVRYGRGDALLTLYRNKDVFGFDIDLTYQLLIRFMEGDLRFLVEEDQATFAERAFFLLNIYQHMNPNENRKYVETALRCKILPSVWHNELENYILIYMLMDWGEYDKAKAKLDALSLEIEQNGWDGLIPYAANLKLEYDLRIRNWKQIGADIKQAEERLEQFPYQREQGQFNILKGIAMYGKNPHEALQCIDQGLDILKRSRFLPHLMSGLHTLISFAQAEQWGGILEKYEKEWDRFSRHIGLSEMEGLIRQQLQTHLGSF